MPLSPSEIADILRLRDDTQRAMDDARRSLMPVADEFLRTREQLLASVQSSSEQLESVRRSTAVEAARQYSAIGEAARGLEQFRQTIEQATRFSFPVGSTLGMVATILEEARKQGSFVEQVRRAIVESPAMEMAAQYREMVATLREAALSPAFQSAIAEARQSDSFIERITADMAALVTTEGDDDEAVATFESGFSRWIATLPRNAVVQSFVLSVLVTLLMTWYQACESAKSEARILEDAERKHQAVLAVAARLADQVQAIAPRGQMEHIRVVTKRLHVRVAPDMNAEGLILLEPGMRVKAIAHSDGWIEVEYFDPETKSMKNGWAAEVYTKEAAEESR